MNTFGITDRGAVRRDNQDSFLIERLDDRECVIAVLCDGMGGEKAGNIASDLAVKTYVAELRDRILSNKKRKPDIKGMMEAACDAANHMIYSYSCFDTDYTGMGTTMVSAVIYGDTAYVLNVGDSRCYKLGRKRMAQVTRDHSLVQDMVERGEITPEQARVHPRRNVITRALGVNELVPCDIFTPKLQRGGGVGGGLVLGDRGDKVVVHARDAAVLAVMDGEEAHHIGQLAREGTRKRRLRLAEGEVRPAPVRRGDDIQRAVELVHDAAVIPQVQAAEQHEHHRRYRRHGRADEAPRHAP